MTDNIETAAAPSAPPGDGAAHVAADLLGAAPSASQHADKIAQHIGSDNPSNIVPSGGSSRGRGRPRKYATEEERRAAEAAQRRARGNGGAIDFNAPNPNADKIAARQQQAKFYANMFFGAFSTLDEVEAKPTEPERKMMEDSVYRTLERYDMDYLPAALELAITMSTYASIRLQRPKIAEKAKSLWARMKEFFTKKR